MKTFILSILLSLSAWSAIELGLELPSNEVRQGELVKAKLLLSLEAGNFSPYGLKGKKLGKVLYIANVSAFVGKGGQGNYQADATIVFITPPEGQSVTETINGEQVTVTWKQIEVIPVNATKFELADFFVAERNKPLPWLIMLSVLGVLVVVGYRLYQRFHAKKLAKEERIRLREKVLGCKTYDDVVSLWKEKHLVLEKEPAIENQFTELEKTLFKHQFKPARSQDDLQEVMGAYEAFRASVEGGPNGV